MNEYTRSQAIEPSALPDAVAKYFGAWFNPVYDDETRIRSVVEAEDPLPAYRQLAQALGLA